MRKYYKVRVMLNAGEAMSYLGDLTQTAINQNKIINLMRDQVLDCYIKPESPLLMLGENGVEIDPLADGYQQVVANNANLSAFHWLFESILSEDRVERNLIFSPYDEGVAFYRKVALYGMVKGLSVDLKKTEWEAVAHTFKEDGERVLFLRADIEALAAKMNDKPDHRILQEENQQLQRELETLKAEVARLQAENAQLKADDEVNPREKESLYKIIAAMAIDGYGHSLEAKTNSTVQDIVNASTSVGIPTPERTIRKHLSAALEVLPAKPIKT